MQGIRQPIKQKGKQSKAKQSKPGRQRKAARQGQQASKLSKATQGKARQLKASKQASKQQANGELHFRIALASERIMQNTTSPAAWFSKQTCQPFMEHAVHAVRRRLPLSWLSCPLAVGDLPGSKLHLICQHERTRRYDR